LLSEDRLLHEELLENEVLRLGELCLLLNSLRESLVRIVVVVAILSLAACPEIVAPVNLDLTACDVQADCPAGGRCYRNVCLIHREVCNRDGILDQGEDCDDGNEINADACTNECFHARCGDAIVRHDLAPGEPDYEDCETGLDNGLAYCRFDCIAAPRPSRIATTTHSSCVLRRNQVHCWGGVALPIHGCSGPQSDCSILSDEYAYRMIGLNPARYNAVFITDERLISWGPTHLAFLRTQSGAAGRWEHQYPRGMRALRWTVWHENMTQAEYDLRDNLCAVDRAGRIWCTGRNECRQLHHDNVEEVEDGRQDTDYLTPIVGVPPVRDIAIGREVMCAASVAGEVWCWGDTRHWGEWARPCEPQPAAKMAGIEGIVDLTSSLHSFVGRRADGTAIRWGRILEDVQGDSLTRRLSDGEELPLPKPAIKLASAAWGHCVLYDDGTVGCWGRWNGGHNDGDIHTMEGLEGIIDLSDNAFGAHFCALDDQDQIRCWGHNGTGQIGDGSHTTRDQPTLVHEIP
jgi:hypothetical protein